MKPITKSVKKRVGMEMTLAEILNDLLRDEIRIENEKRDDHWMFCEDNKVVVKYHNQVIDPSKIKILVTEEN